MILNAVVLILREVLEAALIISVFLALSRLMQHGRRWVFVALILGFLGATVYASTISYISAAFEGVGQELLNACLHSLIYLSLLVFVVSVFRADEDNFWRRIATRAMTLAVFVASAREGAEIMLYINGFIGSPELLQPVLLGGSVGAGIGISVGIFFYYLLVNMPNNLGRWVASLIIVLLAGSMVSQAVQFLIQADAIASAPAIWDSSSFIDEHSVSGQLLYALIGYEATPAPVQAKAYLLSMLVLVGLAVISKITKSQKVRYE